MHFTLKFVLIFLTCLRPGLHFEVSASCVNSRRSTIKCSSTTSAMHLISFETKLLEDSVCFVVRFDSENNSDQVNIEAENERRIGHTPIPGNSEE